MGPDAASFRDEDVQAVYGGDPRCLLNGTHVNLQKHHILGRGELFGIRPGDPRRCILSSVFNCAIIEESFHKGGLRDHCYARVLLLEAVNKRELSSDYEMTDLDFQFLNLVARWRSQNGL